MDNQPTSPAQPAPTTPPTPPVGPEAISQPGQPGQLSQPGQPNQPQSPAPIPPQPNTPTQPQVAMPPAPTTNPGSFTNPATPVNTADKDIKLNSGSKKRKGLIATIIAIIAVLIIGGGAFAAAYVISNQPQNIIASSLGNILNAKQIVADGDINISLSENPLGISSVTLDFDAESAASGRSATTNISVGFSDGTEAASATVGEVMLSSGTLYLKLDGLTDLYYNTLSDKISDYITSGLTSSLQYSVEDLCYDYIDDAETYAMCIEEFSPVSNPEVDAATQSAISEVTNTLGEVVEMIDGQWLEFSINDIMNHELLASMDPSTRQAITSAYSCAIDKINNFSNYSSELSSLYDQNPFIVMTSTQDSFYNITFDASSLAGYLNGLPRTALSADFASCLGATTSSTTTSTITTADVSSVLEYAPQISAKFDGVFDHHLTELKLSSQSEYLTVSSDLKFSYPSSLDISAPASSTPVMDVAAEAYDKINTLETIVYSL